MVRSIFILGGIFLLSACVQTAPKYWQHKTLPSSQWNTDHNRCKRSVDKHLGLDNRFHADQGLDDYSERMRVYEVGKKQKSMVSNCMRKHGYVPIR